MRESILKHYHNNRQCLLCQVNYQLIQCKMDNQQDKDKDKSNLSKEELEDLRKASLVAEMVKSEGWQVFKEYLAESIRNKWLDPRDFKSKEELAYAYSIA